MSDHSQPSTASRSDSLRTHALGYAKRGIYVFPLWPGTKTPMTAHGFEDATTDQDKINTWWRNTPDANIGIACGASGWAVIDFDTAKEEYGEESEELRLTCEREYPTLVARTRSGGYHRIHSQPETPTIRNSESRMAPAVDTRGDGGYIVAPPSVVEGRYYSWHSRNAIAPFPSALLPKLFRPSVNGNGNGNHTAALNGNGHHGPEPWHKIEAAVMALSHRRSVDHADWLAVGMAIHSEDSGGAGYSLWDRFSQRCAEKYDAEANARRWKSFEAGGGKTIASVYEMASQDDSEWRTRWWRSQYKPAPTHTPYEHEEKQPEEPPELAEHMNRPLPSAWFVGEPPAVEEEQVTVDELPKDEPAKDEAPPITAATYWRPHLHTVEAFISRPPKQWLFENVIGANDFVMIYGESGHGKTHVVLDLAYCAAMGQTFADTFPCLAGRPLSVAYATGEGLGGLSNRLNAVSHHYGTTDVPFYVFSDIPQLYYGDIYTWAASFLAAWDEMAAENLVPAKLDIMILDTYHNASVGADENMAKDGGIMQSAMRMIRDRLGCAVILIHHANKSGLSERGSTSLRASQDTVVKVQKSGENFLMSCEKLKDAEGWKPQGFGLVQAGTRGSVRVFWTGTPDATDTAKKDRKTQQLLNWLQDNANVDGHTAKAIGTALGEDSTVVYKWLTALVSAGEVTRNDKTYPKTFSIAPS